MDLCGDHHEYCTGGYDPEDIVVCGISGKFPSCKNVEELADGLYLKKQLIYFTDERYKKGLTLKTYVMPYDSCGIVNDLDKFDNEFFSVTQAHANELDPAGRVTLEVAYECIVDGGYDPFVELRKKRIGVYHAMIQDDSSRMGRSLERKPSLQSVRCMIPNRVTYSFDFRGPSHALDAACSSSGIAFHNAVCDLRSGNVEAAVVSSSQLNLDPETFCIYIGVGICTVTGNCIPFDAKSDGMLRTDAITGILLMKAKNARRVYAKVCATSYLSAGHVAEGISVPSLEVQKLITLETLKRANVTPDEIDFVEAHATGTARGDPIELNAIAGVYCHPGRNRPLYIGAIKSNIGHTEASSGSSGVIKTCLAFDNGIIPPNLNYTTPNPGSPALVDGRLKVVTEPTPLTSSHVMVNCMGFGGTIVSILLKQNPITDEDRVHIKTNIPRLILFPSTTEEGIQIIFDFVESHREELREEFYALLNKLSFTPPQYKQLRGYCIFKDDKPTQNIQLVSCNPRPVWWVLTGMGCQWSGMGLKLMKLEIFAQSMRRSADILKLKGVDLFAFLQPDTKLLHENRRIIPAFVSIASIQVALIDLLRYLEVPMNGVVGHSTGDLMCAYADGCCTQEQIILASFFRGKSVEEANLSSGAMAAVGLSWSKASELCPEGVYPACDNSEDSVTISGLKEPLEKFVQNLQNEKIFARTVNCYGYSFHCKLVHPAAPSLKILLDKIIPHPKPRSERWVTSSFHEHQWSDPICKTASSDYFVHNLMSPVLFREAIQKIPSNAIIIEVAPHFLLQSILKRSIGSEATFVGLMKRKHEDNVSFLLKSIGDLYNAGVNPKIERLYPAVQFPVPRKTPMISSLIRWKHDHSFYVPKHRPRTDQYSCPFNTDKDSYILDHQIDGRSLFPAAGYVYIVWEALSTKLQKPMQSVSFVLENFKIHKATIITPQSITHFNISILGQNKMFEVTEGNSLVASGEIYECKSVHFIEPEPTYDVKDASAVSGKEIYNELKMTGYEYGPSFQNLLEVNMDGTAGLVMWRGKWIPFLDSLLLFFGILNNSSDFCLPTGALAFKIDPTLMNDFLEKNRKTKCQDEEICADVPVSYNPYTHICRSVGVEIVKLNLDSAPHRKKLTEPSLEEYKFIPYVTKFIPSSATAEKLSHYMWACNQVLNSIGESLGENLNQAKFSISDVQSVDLEDYLSNMNDVHRLLAIFKDISENTSKIAVKRAEWFSAYSKYMGKDLLSNVLYNDDSLRIMVEILSENSFRKQNVVEILGDFPYILPSVVEMLTQFGYVKFKKCVLVASDDAEVDHEVLQKANVQLEKPETIQSFVEDKNQDIVITSFIHGSLSELRELVQTVSAMLKPNGFVLFFHREKITPAEKFLSVICCADLQTHSSSTLENIFKQDNLNVVSKISDQYGGIMYLLRLELQVAPYTVIHMKDGTYSWVDELKIGLTKPHKEQHEAIWLVSRGSPTSGIVGMVNCLKQEPGGEWIKCIFIQDNNSCSQKLPSFSFDDPFYKPLLNKSLLMNVYKDNAWGSYRHVAFRDVKKARVVDHSYIQCKNYGDLSSFQWVQCPIKCLMEKTCSRVHVYYAALNFKDVMISTGKLHAGSVRVKNSGVTDEELLGLEVSGRDEKGKRVFGLVFGRGIATSVLIQPNCIFQVPDHWTLEEAATVPVVYLTCYYALLMRGRLEEGNSILIHSGTGGIGLAAIRIALSMNCEIFVTVGTAEKRDYLRRKFPQLKEENMGCSRDISFENMIINKTKGKGVDVVLNSLADDKNHASMRCVAENGHFLEIGKYDLALDKNMGRKMFLKNITYYGCHLDRLFEVKPSTIKILDILQAMLMNGIEEGVVQPLDRTVFQRQEVEEAFRYMAKGVHIGKLLIKIRDEEVDKMALPKLLRLPAVPITYFYESKVYIVIGGLGGFGIEVTKWIIQKGGRNIILTSRYGARTSYHYFCLKRWKDSGVNVTVSTLNVVLKNNALKLLEEAEKIGPVGGIFNSAVVLKDAFMDAQTANDYREVCGPKATATRHLDNLSRTMCPFLDYFVCFSSISCGRGNAGQTNYGYANSVMERICEERRRSGLHGLAIQWGIIGEVGVVHRHMGDDAMIAGVMAQPVKSCLEAFDAFLQQECPVMSSYLSSSRNKKSGTGDLLSMLAKVLGAEDISAINSKRSFGAMGIDSMVGIEMKQLIEMHCDVELTIHEIHDLTVEGVIELIEKAETEKSVAQYVPNLFTTTTIKLPPHMVVEEPLVLLHAAGSGAPVFLVKLNDNDVQDFRLLAEALNRPVYALLWTKGLDVTDCVALASHFLEIIQDTCEGPFHVIGYGLGGSVAFEMALQSEEVQLKLKSVSLLSGSEDLLNGINNEKPDSKTIESSTLCKFVEQFIPDSSTRLSDLLQKESFLEQRLKVVVNFLTRSSSEELNQEEVLKAIHEYISKRNIIDAYVPEDKLYQDLHLIEDPAEVLPNDITEIKETFSQICHGKVDVYRSFNPQDLSSKEEVEKLSSTILSILHL